jgi:hypothetical protein
LKSKKKKSLIQIEQKIKGIYSIVIVLSILQTPSIPRISNSFKRDINKQRTHSEETFPNRQIKIEKSQNKKNKRRKKLNKLVMRNETKRKDEGKIKLKKLKIIFTFTNCRI